MKPELVAQSGHASAVVAVSFTPDGRTLVTVERSGGFKQWDVASGGCLRSRPTSEQQMALFSPDGRWLITSWAWAACFWDAATGALAGRMTARFRKQACDTLCAAFSPDGLWLALGGWNEVFAWRFDDIIRQFAASLLHLQDDPHTPFYLPPPAHTFPHIGNALALQFLPDNRTLIVGRGDYSPRYDGTFHTTDGPAGEGKLDFWDVPTGAFQKTLTAERLWPNCLAASSDGRFLAVPQRCSAHSRGGMALPVSNFYNSAFPPEWEDGVWLLATGVGEAAPDASRLLRGSSNAITALAFSPDSVLIAAGSDKNAAVRLWKAASGEPIPTVMADDGLRYGIRVLAFSPDGARLGGGGKDGSVALWDAANGVALHVTASQSASIQEVTLSSDGRGMACVVAKARYNAADEKFTGMLHCWNLQTGAQWHCEQMRLQTCFHAGYARQPLLFAPDGRTLALIDTGHTQTHGFCMCVSLRDTAQGTLLGTIDGVERYAQFAFSADSLRLTGTIGYKTWEWDVLTGELLRAVELQDKNEIGFAVTIARAIAPDGRSAACITYDPAREIREATLNDVWTGRVLQRFMQTRYEVTNCQFLADGRSLVLEISSRTINPPEPEGAFVWNLQTGKQEGVLVGAHKLIPVSASPDGRWIAAPGERGAVCLWERSPSALTRVGLETPPRPVYCLTWSADSKILAGSGLGREIYFWDMENIRLAATLTLLPSGVDWVAYTPAGNYDATHAAGPFLRWNIDGVLQPLDRLAPQHHRPGLLQQIFRSD